jgi:hypothetical protein
MVTGASIAALIPPLIRARSAAGRPTLEHLPLSASQFINLIVKKMRYRRKVRTDVINELAAHFEDALRDCKTDQQRQEAAARLITDFGDPKLLAVLLRRAKKRCRPLWRTIVARTLQTFGALILFLILYVAWFLTGTPVITTDYVAELNRIVRPTADESLNAGPLYRKAAEIYRKPSDDFLLFFVENYKEIAGEHFARDKRLAERISELFSNQKGANLNEEKDKITEALADRLNELLAKEYHQTTPAQREFIQEWIEDRNEALQLVVVGVQKPHYWQKYQAGKGPNMWSILLPHMADFRSLAWALRWRAWLSAEQGRYEDAFRDIKSSYLLGQHLTTAGTQIELLVGITLKALAVDTLHEIVAQHEINSATLTAAQNDFQNIMADEDFAPNFETGKLFLYDTIQRCFTKDRFGSGHLCFEALKRIDLVVSARANFFELLLEQKGWPVLIHLFFTHPNRQETREMVDRLYDFSDEVARKTPAQLRAENIDIEDNAMRIIKGNILLEMLVPAISRVGEQCHLSKAHVQAAITILGLLRHKKDKGFYPENLQKLMTIGYLKELPMDPYSDKPLIYRRTDDSFLLYSVGPNFKDDGGQLSRDRTGRVEKWPADGDHLFWPLPK